MVYAIERTETNGVYNLGDVACSGNPHPQGGNATVAEIMNTLYELLEACELASVLLDALRIESGVGNILNEPEKENFQWVDDKLKAALAKTWGE